MKYQLNNNSGVDMTPAMSAYVKAHMNQLELILVKLNQAAKVTASFKKNKDIQSFEITINLNHRVLKANGNCDNFYDSVDAAFHKIKKNIRNYKDKLIRKRKPDGKRMKKNYEDQIIRKKEIEHATMNSDKAIELLEELDHDFLLFVDNESKAPSVVYKRLNNGYGILRLKQASV